MTRREALQRTGLVAAIATVGAIDIKAADPAPAPTGPFQLPKLPYAYDALEPHIDAKTMEIHHSKHHQAYVNNLNKAIAGQSNLPTNEVDLIRDLDKLPENIRQVVRNNGGGHVNHTLFWQIMKKGGGGEPKGDLRKQLDLMFGSFEQFKKEFTNAATITFGSGWAWLSVNQQGVADLTLENLPNQDSPYLRGKIPILGLDVWEHAYYLKYQNRRPEYIAAFWNVVNWDEVSARYDAARKKA
ncbi:MAG TPA: superoxide dismutase [Verrucomicrobiae bacterium]|nr:superoxide dismutase [Verrucomicrobiae bacterium]